MPARANGYLRAFAGTSRNWNSTSVATLVKHHKSDTVNGIAACLRKSEIEALDKYEGYPLVYRRDKIKIEILSENGKVTDKQKASVYLRNDNSLFVPPSDKYLEAVAQTMRDFRLLQNDEEADGEDIKIAVRYAKKPKRILFVYTHKGSPSVRKAFEKHEEE
jgi:hypothetical protein